MSIVDIVITFPEVIAPLKHEDTTWNTRSPVANQAAIMVGLRAAGLPLANTAAGEGEGIRTPWREDIFDE